MKADLYQSYMHSNFMRNLPLFLSEEHWYVAQLFLTYLLISFAAPFAVLLFIYLFIIS